MPRNPRIPEEPKSAIEAVISTRHPRTAPLMAQPEAHVAKIEMMPPVREPKGPDNRLAPLLSLADY
jgi:hypothetical protein